MVRENRHRLNEFLLESAIEAGKGEIGTSFQLGPSVCITSPECVKYILKDNFPNYEKGKLFTTAFGDMLGDGIFNTNGPRWKTQRKTGVKMFTRKLFGTFINDVFMSHSRTLLDRLSGLNGAEVDIQDLYYKFTLDSIGQIAFGVELGCLKQDAVPFADAFDTIQNRVVDRMMNPLLHLFPDAWSAGLKYIEPIEHEMAHQVTILREFGMKVISERRASGQIQGRADLLSYFMTNTDAEGNPHTDDYMIDIILNFIIAGRDTTASTLSWATYELTSHPEEMQKVKAEIDAVLGGKLPSYDVIFQKMPVLRAFINETLRLHPPVPKDVKTAIKDDTLPDGTFIPKGAQILYLPYSMGRSTKVWGHDAAEFRSERWFEDAAEKSTGDWGGAQKSPIENDKHGLPRVYAPDAYHAPIFQGGPRTCIGREMAYFEVSIVLAMLLQRSSVERTSYGTLYPAETIVMPIAGGLKVTVTPLPGINMVPGDDDVSLVLAPPPVKAKKGVAKKRVAKKQGGDEHEEGGSRGGAGGGGGGGGCPFAKSRL
jgi:cytochrome P450